MKKTYRKPELVCHGDVAAITQILGSSDRTDFVFLSGGSAISGNNDIGSVDLEGDFKNGFKPK